MAEQQQSQGQEMTCGDARGLFSELAESELAEAEGAVVRRHLEQCAECAARFEAFRRMAGAIERLPDPAPSEGARLRIQSVLLSQVEARRGAPEVMDVKELAAYLAITPEELEEEIENLPAFEFAGRLRFRKAAIDRWMGAREEERRRGIELSRLRAWRAPLLAG